MTHQNLTQPPIMTEQELLKIAAALPPLTNEEICNDKTETEISDMTEEAWSRFSQLLENP